MLRTMRHGSGVISCLVLLLLTASCRSLSDLDIDYKDCLPPRKPYVETFNDGYQALLDRCWRAENASGGREISVGSSNDLTIAYKDVTEAQGWNDRPPMLLRRLEGDFVFATQAEASDPASNFCALDRGDAAGIIIRVPDAEGSSAQRTVFLIRPFLDANPAPDCGDESLNQPLAIGEAQSNDAASSIWRSPGIGEDGEGEIAVCRYGGVLSYFYHVRGNVDAGLPDKWEPLKATDLPIDSGTNADATDGGGTDAGAGTATTVIGTGPIDVGLTTTLSPATFDRHHSVQGTFNWVLLSQSPLEDCISPLEHFDESIE